ncbi:aspartic proteinase NANA, chloroplast-like [Humulus lupulus]|uniref:aspartic proteinase NANA, chloroplast-like n=1 Tax=Humulus lupulus TaxID=3486 RepID=UPI002B408523|nr:aspartic proteinase NANA, chloroplast-like [Humulus lupulus]
MNFLRWYFLLFAIINNGMVIPINGFLDEITTRLELIHRNSPKLSGHSNVFLGERPRTQMENVKQFHQRDVLRRRTIETASSSSSVKLPINSGSDYGTGEYFVHVTVGTPGQRFVLVADTGSELTWINCRYRNDCGRDNKCAVDPKQQAMKPTFKADQSSSFRTVPCSSAMCKTELAELFSLAKCPTPSTPCGYDYRYLQGSAALGFFGNDTVSVDLTNGMKRRLNNVLIGCTQSIKDEQGNFKGAHGVLGLGNGKYTFTTKAAQDFGAKFSYCLVDHLSSQNLTNYIVFGSNRPKTALLSRVQRTPLVLGGVLGPLYGVNVMGISVGGKPVKIPAVVWDAKRGGGTILDSGTSLTFLAEPAYRSVTAAFSKYMSKFQRLPDDGGPFEFCYNSTRFRDSLVPSVKIQLANGAVFEPPMKSYILDVAPETRCLGIVSASWPGTSIIGNIMQQNHLWEFDLGKSLLSFAPSTCT